MPVQHSLPAKNTRSQIHQGVLTPTERAPLDCTPSVHQLSEHLDRGPSMEGEAPFRRGGVNLQELTDITLELDTSNDVSTAARIVSLVSEIKTPSLPPSVHAPFIIPSQSLLPSRDESCKEIKDFLEDVAISSLHLFQGDIDLPHISFHASLEEQEDEEEEPEEIENALKVVPPAYHQYLDVFPQVKVEKLPPHCACDHHIELEGLLPPEALSQFQILKEAFTPAPILFHFNPSIPTIVETNSSDYALDAVLSQVNDSGKNPFAVDSCKLLPAELNYEIHDKELLGIVWAFKSWRAFLLSLSDPFEVLTDHSSLQ
ncbi:hypothetical protein O181_012520 [Austropuccinia psidii MF-1]|uniref:Reverse transcriptase/retrotransposon-derived protein RNase H-like domain-containing protein n=1 Tax=Austropuccinia psidii MF-1 TaxID=1389203 RepID=A0A9Q3BX90_9BASI|nr:hypothetical protein [Austropuccinia psidii MF-1]